jgi:predicted ATPase/DNA-binding CsgD family transcriptional regulator
VTTRTSRSPLVTKREREVWRLVSRHLTNRQIADELCVSERTVEGHVSSLMRKVQVADRRSLARRTSELDASDGPERVRWPVSVSSFVGRASEREELVAAVDAHRMVTVTGPGGVGKTRLALHVAQEVAATRRDGGWFVDLVHVTDPAMVVAAVASTIGAAEQPGGSLDEAVVAALSASDAVIVLDNCEHLIGGVRSCVERLLASCASLTLIATSRARLMAPFEWVYAVPGLSVPAEGGDAVTLFVERAIAAGGDDALDRQRIGDLCRALDGMALAIELAAARVPSLGLDGLIAGLDRRLRLLTSGAGVADRHRSLRDAIAWSYDLLAPPDAALLRGVSVFTSWFDVDSAVAVAGLDGDRAEIADGLARLTDHHLLVVAAGEPTRYRALETIRQFGAEQLTELGQFDGALERHRSWCHEQLGALAQQERDDAWCERFDRVAAEVRASIMSAVEHHLDIVAGDLAERLAEQLFLRGRPAEAQHRYEQAAELSPIGIDRVRLLRLAGGAAAARMMGNDTLRLLDAAATEAAFLGEHAAVAEARAWMVIYTHSYSGIMADVPGDAECEAWLEDARAHACGSPSADAAIAAAATTGSPFAHPDTIGVAERAARCARDAGAPLAASAALDHLSVSHLTRADLAKALETLGRRGEVLEPLPLDASTGFQFNDYLLMASEVHLAAGNLAEAARYADTLAGLACYREQDHLAVARRIKVDAMAGHVAAAVARGDRFRIAWERAGRPIAGNLGVTAYTMAMVHGLLGDESGRREWSDITNTLLGDPRFLQGCFTGWVPTLDALVALDRDQPDLAVELLSADIDGPDPWAGFVSMLWRPWYAALWAEAAVLTDHPDAATRLQRSVAATSENPIASTIVDRARDLAHGVYDNFPAHARTFGGLGCVYQQRRTETLLAQQR